MRSYTKTKDITNRAQQVVKDLLSYMQEYKPEEFPTTCGACGTPVANCGTGCTEAASMSAHNQAIRRARQWLEEMKKAQQG